MITFNKLTGVEEEKDQTVEEMIEVLPALPEHVNPWGGFMVPQEKTVDTAYELMEKAGLDWEVDERPILFPNTERNNYNVVPDKKIIVRGDTEFALGVVGKGYKPLQNYEAFVFIDELVKQGHVTYHSAGSFRHGRLIFVQCLINESEILPGDVHQKFMLFVNSHDGTFAITMKTTSIRVVCMNTLMAALRQDSRHVYRVKHTQKMDTQLNVAQEAIDDARMMGEMHDRFLAGTLRLPMGRELHDSFLSNVFPYPKDVDAIKTKTDNKRAELSELMTLGVGQDIPGVRGTGYAAFNGLTEYVNYHRGTRGKDDDEKQNNRFNSALFGSGASLIARGVGTLNGYMVQYGIQI